MPCRNKKRDRSASPPPMKSNKKNNRYTGNRQGQAGNNNRQGQAGNNNGNGNNRQGPPGNNNRQGVAGGNGPLHLDQQRESARARRFGNGTALGAVSDSWQGSVSRFASCGPSYFVSYHPVLSACSGRRAGCAFSLDLPWYSEESRRLVQGGAEVWLAT